MSQRFKKLNNPWCSPMLFICKYLQTYNVYSEIWGGVKKIFEKWKKMCIINQDEIILLNRLKKKVIWPMCEFISNVKQYCDVLAPL